MPEKLLTSAALSEALLNDALSEHWVVIAAETDAEGKTLYRFNDLR